MCGDGRGVAISRWRARLQLQLASWAGPRRTRVSAEQMAESWAGGLSGRRHTTDISVSSLLTQTVPMLPLAALLAVLTAAAATDSGALLPAFPLLTELPSSIGHPAAAPPAAGHPGERGPNANTLLEK